jgi:hypothetical protein
MKKNNMMSLKKWLLLILPVSIYMITTIVVILCFWQNEGYYIKHHLLYVLLPIAIYWASVIALIEEKYLLSYIGTVAAFIINIVLCLMYRIGLTFYGYPIGINWISVQYCLFHLFSFGITIGVCISYRLLYGSKEKTKSDIKIKALASCFSSIVFIVLLTVLNNITAVPRISNYILPVSGDLFIYELTAAACACMMIAAAFGKMNKVISFLHKAISSICFSVGIIAYYLTSLFLPFQNSNNARFESLNYVIVSPLFFLGLLFGINVCIRTERVKT